MYQPLLTPVYCVRPIYTELLHASSRLRKNARVETARPSNGLVIIMCSPKALGEEPLNATAYNKGLAHWLGSASHVGTQCLGSGSLGTQCLCCCQGSHGQIRLPKRSGASSGQGLGSGARTTTPAWWSWDCDSSLVPRPMQTHPAKDWQTTLLRRTSCWPFRLPQDMTALHPPSKATFIRLRKRGQSKHILGGLTINWRLIAQHLWTNGPSVLTRGELERQLFLLRSGSTTEVAYRGNDKDKWDMWTQQRDLAWRSQTTMPAQMTLRMSAWIIWGRTNYQAYLDWLDYLEHQQTQSGRFKTKKGYWVVKRRPQTWEVTRAYGCVSLSRWALHLNRIFLPRKRSCLSCAIALPMLSEFPVPTAGRRFGHVAFSDSMSSCWIRSTPPCVNSFVVLV